MAINDIVQTIAEARVDARSLSEFVFKPAGFKVTRRLAPTVNTLQFYINRFNSLNGDFSSSVSVALSSLNSSVAEAEGKVAYIESTVQDAINDTVISSGFVTIDSFELGVTLTQRNQALRHAADGKLYRWAGDLPKVVPASSTPTSSGGMGDNAWLEVSDATLRQDLTSPVVGAAMVGRGVVAVDSIADLLALPEGQRKEGLRYLVKGYHAGSDVGGGEFYWNTAKEKEKHDGGYVLSPSVPTVSGQAGDGLNARLLSFLDGVGETDPSGVGCFVRVTSDDDSAHANVYQFGALGDLSIDTSAVITRMLSLKRPVVIPPGDFSWRSTLTISEYTGTWISGSGYQTRIFPDMTGDCIRIHQAHGNEGAIVENMVVARPSTGFYNIPDNFIHIRGWPHQRVRNIKFNGLYVQNSVIKNESAYGLSLERIRCYYCRVGHAFLELNNLPDETNYSYVADAYDIDVTGLRQMDSGADSYAFFMEGGMFRANKVVIQSSQHAIGFNTRGNINLDMTLENTYVEANDGYMLRNMGGNQAASPPLININGWRDIAANSLHRYALGGARYSLSKWMSTTSSENYDAGSASVSFLDTSSRYARRIGASKGANRIGSPHQFFVASGTTPASMVFQHVSEDPLSRLCSWLILCTRPAQTPFKTTSDLYIVLVDSDDNVIKERLTRLMGDDDGVPTLPQWGFALGTDRRLVASQSQGGIWTAQICSPNTSGPTQ